MRRSALAETAGRQIVKLVEKGIRASDIMTEDAVENAMRFLLASGGSTNAIIHLTAIAGRLGIELTPARFDEFSRSTPTIVNLKPSGEYLMEDLFYAGGIESVLNRLSPLLHLDALTVNGHTLGENIADAVAIDDKIVKTLESPMHAEGGKDR